MLVLEGVFKRIEELEEDNKKNVKMKHTLNRLDQKISSIEFKVGKLKLDNDVIEMEKDLVDALAMTPTSPLKFKSPSFNEAQQAPSLSDSPTSQPSPKSEGKSVVETEAADDEKEGEEFLEWDSRTKKAGKKLQLDTLCNQLAESESRMDQIQSHIAEQLEQMWEKINSMEGKTNKRLPTPTAKTTTKQSGTKNEPTDRDKKARIRAEAESMDRDKKTRTRTESESMDRDKKTRTRTESESMDKDNKTRTKTESTDRVKKTKTKTESMDRDDADRSDGKPAEPVEQAVDDDNTQMDDKSSVLTDPQGDEEIQITPPADKPSEEVMHGVANSSRDIDSLEDARIQNSFRIDPEAFEKLKKYVEACNDETAIALHNMKSENEGMRVLLTNLQTTVLNSEKTSALTSKGLKELQELQDKFKSRKEKDEFARRVTDDKLMLKTRRASMNDDMDVKDGIDKIVEKQKLQEEATKDEARARNAIMEKAYAAAFTLQEAIANFMSSTSLEHGSFFTGKMSETVMICEKCIALVGDDKTKTDAMVLFNKLLAQCKRNSKITSSAVGIKMQVSLSLCPCKKLYLFIYLVFFHFLIESCLGY